MVEINNQRKAFLDMLAWSEGTDNGRQKTRTAVMTSLYESYLPITRSPSQTCHAKPKTQSTGAGRYQLLFPPGMSLQAAWPERLLSEKSGRCGIAAD